MRFPSRLPVSLLAVRFLPGFLALLLSSAEAALVLEPTPFPPPEDTPAPAAPAIALGKPFPFFSSSSRINAEEPGFEMAQWKDRKAILVHFWSSSSVDSQVIIPGLLGLYAAYHPLGLEVVGVSLDLDPRIAEVYALDWRMRWPQVCEGRGWESTLVSELRPTSLPANYLIDRQGILRGVNLYGEALDARVASLLGVPSQAAKPGQFVIDPPLVNPGETFTLRYVPLRRSHVHADRLMLATNGQGEWPPAADLLGQPQGDDAKQWSAEVRFPADRLTIELYIGEDLQGRPLSQLRTSTDVVRGTLTSGLKTRIELIRESALKAEDYGDWGAAGKAWSEILEIHPVEPLAYAEALLGRIEAASRDSRAGNPETLTGQIAQAAGPVDAESAENAVRRRLMGVRPSGPWTARAAVDLLFAVQRSGESSVVVPWSYVDARAWAFYRAGAPELALQEHQRVPPIYVIQNPGMALRGVLYFLVNNQREKAETLYETVGRSAGLLVRKDRDLADLRQQLAKALGPLPEQRIYQEPTTPTLSRATETRDVETTPGSPESAQPPDADLDASEK